jgi:DNA polymerase-3 subunit alpha
MITEENKGKYTNLHMHSKYSVLDGLGEVENIVIKCKELGFEGVCISDHGNAFCWYELQETCKKHGMKPIFANEMYFTPNGISVKEKLEGWKPAYHLLLIAQNDIGFKNLMKLTSISWIQGKYYKPRIGYSELKQYGEGIIVLHACIGGLIAQLVLEKRLEEAEDHLLKFKKILGDRYYLECQYTGIKEQETVNKQFKEWAKKHSIPYVITADSHYVDKEDSDYHAALVAINIGGKFKKVESLTDKTKEESDTDNSGLFYTPNQYYIKSWKDLSEYFSSEDDQKAFALTNEIAKKCNVTFKTSGNYLPRFAPTNEDERDILEKICKDNLEKLEDVNKQEYLERLNFELNIIYKMGYCGYFLVVADYIKWANDQGILVGPGRGSAAGALVAYLTSITRVDPIKYGLLFERFLSRGRAKVPLIEFEELPISEWEKLNNTNKTPF